MENVCKLHEEAMFTNVAYIDLHERVFSITPRWSGAYNVGVVFLHPVLTGSENVTLPLISLGHE